MPTRLLCVRQKRRATCVFVLTLALTAFASSAFASLLQSYGVPCVGSAPPSNQAWIYSDAGFGSVCSALGPGFYPDAAHSKMRDNWLSSIRVGHDVQLVFFSDSVLHLN
jgi:hypothetical protein